MLSCRPMALSFVVVALFVVGLSSEVVIRTEAALLGGWSPADVTSPGVQSAASSAVKQIQDRHGSGKATPEPVVGGRSKRQVSGGVQLADVSSELVLNAAQFAARELTSQSNGIYTVELGDVSEATRQLVAGVKLTITCNVKLSSCASPRGTLLALCSVLSVRREEAVCTVEVWDQVWRTPRYLLLSHRCHPSSSSSLSSPLLYSKNNNKTPKSSANQVYSMREGPVEGKSEGETKKKKIGASYEEFEAFKQKYGRTYNSVEEDKQRYAIFQENMRLAQFIQDHDLGTATYGANQFADFTRQEFSAYISKKPWNKQTDPRMKVAEIPGGPVPASFDWRAHGAVSGVKNQGSCGSCWAFSVTGNIEGQWAIKKSQLIPLSEQELVDCDKLDEGCNGGLPSNAYTEIQRIGGLETETDYPYKAEDEKCIFTRDKIKVYINGSVNISSNEADMAAWLAVNGPMSIGINAFAMQFYFGGISHPWKLFCPDALDHGVVIVGYDVKHGYFGDTPYWIVKNSWGASWGEKGYYYVYRGDGTCGLNEMVSSAIIN